jgi:hypothetical protein
MRYLYKGRRPNILGLSQKCLRVFIAMLRLACREEACNRKQQVKSEESP